ncbi:MAG: exonuclease, partial [Leeuwenhoekiella sp.]
IESRLFAKKDLVLVDRGRSREERAALLIKDGIFKGYGYFNLNHQLNNEILNRIITPVKDTKEARYIIQSYLRTSKSLKVVELDSLKR